MDLSTIKLTREAYRELLSTDASYNDVLEIITGRDEYQPTVVFKELEPESDLSFNEEQRQLSETLLDLHTINNSIIETKDDIVDLIETIDNTIANSQESIKKQSEQVEDLNMICGQDSLYNAIIPIYVTDFGDTAAEIIDSKTIGASVISSTSVPYDIVSLSGNGYSGNTFVYKDNEFVSETDDRSNLEYIFDSNDLTVYEYSRLYAKEKSSVILDVINYDDRPVECTLTLSAKQAVCRIQLQSSDPHVIVTNLETSDDGVTFYSRLSEPIAINDLTKIYNHAFYVYGSNTLCFPYATYVRITLSNDETEEDILAVENNGSITKLDAFRKKIAITGIQLYSSQYQEANLISREILEGGNIDKVSLFVSEYIPDHFTSNDYISYSLVINGQEFEVVPANTMRKGTTIIKYSEESSSLQDTTSLIHETIKSIQIKVKIKPYNKTESPYISNVKLCIGKNTGNIYV